MRRVLILVTVFLFQYITGFGQSSAQPNIIFVFADDLGYGDLGCYGSTTNRTPNLDQMALQGIKFTDFYAASPVCSPSRAALLTGRYPIRAGVTSVLPADSKTGLDTAEYTMAEMLKERGYATACIGKWHLGHLPEFLPASHGFDYYFGIPYSNDMIPTPYLRNGQQVVATVNQDSITTRYTQEALEFIEKNKSKPFFLYLPHSMPHVPIAASPAFKGKSTGGLYGDVIEELDWSVGQILNKVKALGLEENTLIVFSSDNGPWLVKGKDAGSAGILREGKQTTFEGGMRVPAIAYWKGKIKPGMVNKQLATMMDWLPTFASLTGDKLPNSLTIDGKDLTGVLAGNGQRDGQELFYFYNGQMQAYRSGKWKIKLPYAGNKGHQGLKVVAAHPVLLFDLSKDPGEKNNLASKYPERTAYMQARMKEFEQSFGKLPQANKIR